MDKRIFFSACCLVIIFAMMSGTTSCGQVGLRAEALSGGYERMVDDNGEVTADFTAAMAELSAVLLEKTVENTEKGDNLLLSPLSASLCLGLLANGAEGETLAELETLLGMKRDQLNPALYAYVQSLSSDENGKLISANSIWYKKSDITVKDSYLQTTANWFDAEQYSADFDATTARDINEWVKKNTDGMIREIVNADDVNSSLMYLINTLLFDAKWSDEYENKDIKKESFTSYNGTHQSAEMMRSDESRYLTADGAIGFAKYYKNTDYSFVGLLPDEDVDVYEFAAALKGEDWLDMWSGMQRKQLKVKIPEFKFESSLPLKDMLKQLGVSSMFSSASADFSSMGIAEDGNLYCSDVKQKAVIDVNREGTKAAAVTWAEMKAESAAPVEDPICIYLDRPFVFAIVDNATGLPLFVGVTATIE